MVDTSSWVFPVSYTHLPAGQCFNGPGQHRGAVQHFQVQPSQGVAPLGALHQAQGVAAPAEGGEKPVGAEKHLVQHDAKHILQNGYFQGVGPRKGFGEPCLLYTSTVDGAILLQRLQEGAGLSQEMADWWNGTLGHARKFFDLPGAFVVPISTSLLPVLSLSLIHI